MSEGATYGVLVGIYIVVIVGLAVYIAGRWIDDPGDFMIAGREIGSLASAFSLLAIDVRPGHGVPDASCLPASGGGPHPG